MTIDEAKAAKAALSERIRLALREFTDDTGLVVERLDVNPNRIVGGGCNYWVELEVML
jgi:inosine/xanthosine triphosphate pyrophosphatase family protein